MLPEKSFIIEPFFLQPRAEKGDKIKQKLPVVWCATIPSITSHWKMPQHLPQINVEVRSHDVSFVCPSGISLVEHSQQTLTEIAVSATREFEKIVTPSNCTVGTVSQKEVSSDHVACWKPKPRCGIWPQTKIRNVQLRSPTSYLWCYTFHVNSCSMQRVLILRYVSCKQVRIFAYLHNHFPHGKTLHPFASRVFAIYNPWIVLAAIYTMHSEKQETFDCTEHILCAQYHGKRYFLHFHKLMQTTNRVAQQKFHRNNRTSWPKHIFHCWGWS